MKAIIGIMTSPTSRSNVNPFGEQYRNDTSWGMWYFSLNISIKAGFFTKRSNLPISNKQKRKNTWGDNGVMKNGRPRRFSEEIKKNSKLKLTWTKAGTDLRNSWEDLWKFFESMMDDLMFGVSLNVWMLWRFWTVMKNRENNPLMSLYIRDWKRGGFYPAQILKGNTVRWIKIPPLDQNPFVGC